MEAELCPWEDTIIIAAASGNTDELQRELEKGTNVNVSDHEYQRTPLYWAVLRGHDAAVQLLLSHGANSNTPEPAGGKTPLLVAAAGTKGGHESVVRRLLGAGADTDTPDMSGDTPLIVAARNGKIVMLKLLLEGGADPNICDWRRGQTALSLAAEAGHDGMVDLLCLHSATASLADDQGMTPMAHALENDHEGVARKLADHEALHDPRDAAQILSDTLASVRAKIVDPYGDLNDEAALPLAAADGCEDVVTRTLDHGVNVDVTDEDGRTPLSHAAGNNNIEIATLLLDRGADVNPRDNMQWTPLMAAAERGHEQAISLLLERGADVNARDDNGMTPLLLIAADGNTKALTLLLDAGGDPSARDQVDNLTIMGRAAEADNVAMVEILLARKISPRDDDKTILCALHNRSKFDRVGTDGYNFIKRLLDHGADAYLDAWVDDRPLVVAAEHGNEDIVALLLKAECESAALRQEHIRNAICVAAEEGEEACLKLLMNEYVPGGKEVETPWEWAKSYHFGRSYELLRPYFDPSKGNREEPDGSDEGE
ncbi:ankyrin repeat domain-containing protein [Verticillium alfalfae VaMs.102]|uniref:Ankyrin repeat domain-containing protein n=1 Tax=Verticillium alfalfae (strain VaMs.102 / ATCC MYA-4576 / FGSC 10136) TaxID=526221 RepID=C9SYW9_VERA1|nr:ankyrin repeat domain-containing protein [Verticillium alfalfae VaMs.102]EEY23984.1 ankyrin repeat domain-containing protein [Verticillium alfalfae VaMs.102]